ncbi:MAG: trigger factor [Rhodobacteraceae bacterium]|nr:trigger factor [Paracoccaceae bacterium]
MNVTQTLNDGLKRAYEITITRAELDAKVHEKLAEAQPGFEMRGFRKGKVPMPLLKKQFGAQMMGEAMQDSIDGAMRAHMDESGDRPAMQPEVRMLNEDWTAGDDVVVQLSYEALPDIPDIDYKSLSLERLVVTPAAEEVDEALGQIAESAQNFATKTGKATRGDQIVIDFLGTVDGKAFDGGAAEDYPLVLGADSFIPGFGDQMIGVTAGEERRVEVSFPDDYQTAHLAGKTAVFKCTVKDVKKPVPAVLDDALARQFGAENLEGLKGRIEARLRSEYGSAARQVLKRQLFDQLDAQMKFELPPSLVDTEARQIAHQLWHEDNPGVRGHDHPEIETTGAHTRMAERRVRLGLLLAELGRKNDVQVSEAEMSRALMAQARQYPGQERQFLDLIRQNETAKQQLRAPLFEDKVVDFVLEMATISEKEVGKDDLRKAVETLEDEPMDSRAAGALIKEPKGG